MRLTNRRLAGTLFAAVALMAIAIPQVGYAAISVVRIVTPAGITIDGSSGDWDNPSKDFLSDMYTAGKPDKPVLAKLYGRYDCGTNTFYVHVVTIEGWVILPSDNDNYVKLGQTDKLVDGTDAPGGSPPSFSYIGSKAWEAAFNLDPGSYLGENGLNVHAQVEPENKAETAAVADRRLDVTIECPKPTPTPTAKPTPTPTVAPTAPPSPSASAEPSASASEEPSASASEETSASASAEASASASAEPSASASEAPSGSLEPSASASEEASASASEEASASASAEPSASASEAPSGSVEPSASASEEASASASEEASASASEEASASASASELPSGSPEPSASASETPSGSVAPSAEAPSESTGLGSEAPSGSASAPPSGGIGPAESASPSGSVLPETGEPPIIVTKVDDQGTKSREDDQIVGGAKFEIRLDDGDGVYEPGADDGAPLAVLDAPDGHAVFHPDQVGDYWVTEVTPPKGLSTAHPELVKYTTTVPPQNCAVYKGQTKCVPDDDNAGGFTIAVIVDSPKGQQPPSTDTELVAAATSEPSNDTLWWLVAGLSGAIAAVAVVARTSRRGDHR